MEKVLGMRARARAASAIAPAGRTYTVMKMALVPV